MNKRDENKLNKRDENKLNKRDEIKFMKRFIYLMMLSSLLISVGMGSSVQASSIDNVSSYSISENNIEVLSDMAINNKVDQSEDIIEEIEIPSVSMNEVAVIDNYDVSEIVDSSFTITVPKNITLSGEDGTGSYDITITAHINDNQKLFVIPEATFILSTPKKFDVEAVITQPSSIFTKSDLGDSETISTSGSIVAEGLTKGIWSGSFTFSIGLDTY